MIQIAEVLHYFGVLCNGHNDTQLHDTGQRFVPDSSGLDDFLSSLGKLSPGSQTRLENKVEDIVKNECQNNKSPGLDGLPYEFYKATWDIIGEDFTCVLQLEMANFKLIESDRHGATRLASKVEGVPSVSELRPITLLNCDYKILSKCFVKRVTPVLPEGIKSGQLCSIGDKNILFGVSNVMSSIDYITLHNVPAYMSTYDMFKAWVMTRLCLDTWRR